MSDTPLKRWATVVIAGFAAFAACIAAARAAEPTAAGLWQKLTDGKPVVWFVLLERDGVYEGAIAKTFPKPGEDPNPLCTKCQDDRKDAPVLGLSMIRGMKRNGLSYEDGTILDPRDGSVYRARMTVSADGQTLTLHGYVLIPLLGKDETWNRLPDSAVGMLDPAIAARYLPAQVAPAQAQVAPAPARPPGPAKPKAGSPAH
jgi:uncharacterized protein (DUF2147 family)